MHDLYFHGPRFTWSRDNLLKRLDKVICNDDWVQRFADYNVLHLFKFSSDHRPIMVNCNNPALGNVGNRPFRFQAVWLTNNSFK